MRHHRLLLAGVALLAFGVTACDTSDGTTDQAGQDTTYAPMPDLPKPTLPEPEPTYSTPEPTYDSDMDTDSDGTVSRYEEDTPEEFKDHLDSTIARQRACMKREGLSGDPMSCVEKSMDDTDEYFGN